MSDRKKAKVSETHIHIPKPRNWGDFDVEPFEDYCARWPDELSHIPNGVIETWIHRHWREFQSWLQFGALEWCYELHEFDSNQVMSIGHVGEWVKTLRYWGDDLHDKAHRKSTWLGSYMLEHGTTPAPIIVAESGGSWEHPREGGAMQEPYQLVEGHLRLAYLQAMIRRNHSTLRPQHSVYVATLPREKTGR